LEFDFYIFGVKSIIEMELAIRGLVEKIRIFILKIFIQKIFVL